MEQETSVVAGPDFTVWALVMQADPVVKGSTVADDSVTVPARTTAVFER